MRVRIATALLGSSVSIIPLQAATWDYLSMDGVSATTIVSDADHARVFVGTIEGFHVYDIGSDLWTEQDEEGWIGRSVHSIAPHELFPGRVLTGRQNAFFKGYIELTNDVSADGAVVHESGAGAVNGLAADHTDANRFYAVTGSDVVPGEFLRSVDGGVSWSLMGSAGHAHMTSVTVALDGTVYVGAMRP